MILKIITGVSNIKEYIIRFDDRMENFYEDMSKLLNCPVEEIVQNILKENIETMTKLIDMKF